MSIQKRERQRSEPHIGGGGNGHTLCRLERNWCPPLPGRKEGCQQFKVWTTQITSPSIIRSNLRIPASN
jgi:hypothetical protein